jgi:hypothetical protein
VLQPWPECCNIGRNVATFQTPTSPELKKIDQILDKARSGLAHLESLPHSANSFYYLLLIDNPEKVHFFFIIKSQALNDIKVVRIDLNLNLTLDER